MSTDKMPPTPLSNSLSYTLSITADARRNAQLRLLDSAGRQRAWHQADFSLLEAMQIHALFDLRNFLVQYVKPNERANEMARLGVCIAEKVLGEEIFLLLWNDQAPRTLHIELPPPTETEGDLAALLTRIPWEIARPGPTHATLGERNLHICIRHAMPPGPSHTLELKPDEPIRVLFVFAEARDTPPLAMRLERRAILRLFQQKIYPHRQIVAHTLAHGVTHTRLAQQIGSNGGYHIIHWSGHGQRNVLELAKSDGSIDLLSGEGLINLLYEAGVALPRLVFLSACNSGNSLPPRNWSEFFSQDDNDDKPATRSFDEKDIAIPAQPGFSGTAHNLLQAGVPSVLAMRFSVGDEYSRELALAFYQALLADAAPKNVAGALVQARKALLRMSTPFPACDHATPLLYGIDQAGLAGSKGRSPALSVREKRLPPDASLKVEPNFVGRTWELARLGAKWLDSESACPLAQLTGLAGVGKSALAAEILDLCESQFDWVLLSPALAQAQALSLDALLAGIDKHLRGEQGIYCQHVAAKPADAIYRAPSPDLSGPQRMARMTHNLVRALQDEAILLVLDQFDSQIKPLQHGSGKGAAGDIVLASCRDPAWDTFLAELTAALPGTRSRLLITCRLPLAAIHADAVTIELKPLPPDEAKLYLRQHPQLRAMYYSQDSEERVLAQRLLSASRFHPLLMAQLAQLAVAPETRQQLELAVWELERDPGLAQLGSVFDAGREDAGERGYLESAVRRTRKV